MKRMLCLTLALGLLLCACGGDPAGTTAPPETTLPAQTAAPTETTAPAETTPPTEPAAPTETTVPPETAAPPETSAPVTDSSYTVRIADPDTQIYAGPAFLSGSVAMLNETGTYTIVEEQTDADGNTWGRLKSGAGWLCLTQPSLAPIHADYAEETFNAFHAYWSEDTEYITSIGFTASETLTDVSFVMLDWFERGAYTVSEELYTIETMAPDQPFLAQVCFYGDMTTYGIQFTDADGAERCYAISISGMDGSLLCTEYQP